MFHYRQDINHGVIDVYRFPFEPVDSNMFFIPVGETGFVFDPNENEGLFTVFEQYGTRHVTIILTHEHYDHTCGTQWLQSRIESTLFCQQDCARAISTAKGNNPKLVAFVLSVRDSVDGGHRYDDFMSSYKDYSLCADATFDKEADLEVGNLRLKCYSMPGHSSGSSIFVLDDRCVFTGDSLIKDTPVILRFPDSDRSLYNQITRPFLKSLDKNMMVFPGHGEPFLLHDAKYL